MAKITGNHELAQRMCRALDLNPRNVAKIDLKIYPDEVVHANVKLLIEEDQFKDIIIELEYCNFVEKKDDPET